MAREKTVYEVLVDTDTAGPAGDGTIICRFWTKASADKCAAAPTCYGRPATVQAVEDVPPRLFNRWSISR